MVANHPVANHPDNGNNLMNLYDPASGINSNFRWKHLDFTGRVFSNANPTNPYQSVQGRGTLISPVHFLYAVHFNPWLRPYQPANNDTCKIYDAAGNATTVTVLSSLIVPGGFDTGVAILSQPVSSTQYFLLSGRNNYLRALSAPDSFNNYLVGPTQTGTVGVGLPYYDQDIQLNFITDSSATSYADYRDIYSIPHSEWHGGNIITGDSSTQAWVVSGNRLLLAGHTYYGGNKITGPYYGHRLTSIIHCLTTLNQVYYGNAFAYSLTAVSFD
ncbi:MAG: hypothetical protein EBS53_12560 [Bacteroidetes bacterium]|nr:hypothetical protein [Bacteroidota bacterium]